MINKKEESSKILKLLYKGNGLSRKEINGILKIRPTTLQEIINSLTNERLLHEPERNSRKTGAKSPKLYINPDYAFLLGIDLGSSCLKAVVTDFNGRILHMEKGEYVAAKDKEKLLKEIFSVISGIKNSEKKLWRKIKGIGLADPGPVDISKGISLFACNIKGWNNLRFSEMISERYKLPAALLTASHAKALNEHFHSREDLSSLFVVDMGNGIGAALIRDGELFRGFTNTEMEFGHILVNENGRQCACGRNGCLEAETGSPALMHKFKIKTDNGARSILTIDKNINEITLFDIYGACLKNDPVALSLIHELAEYLAKGLSYVIQLINPEKIIIHGPLTILGARLPEYIKHNLYKYCFPSVVEKTDIECSSLDEFSSASGACIAIREKLLFKSFLK